VQVFLSVHLAVNVKLWMYRTLGGVYQAGTLSGNPLAMRAGIEMFKHLRQPDFYTNLNAKLKNCFAGLQAAAMKQVFHLKLNKQGHVWFVLYRSRRHYQFRFYVACDVEAFKKFSMACWIVE
jgi:glutamate-1-semialdehyde 2,1-aminomutase